ncbi:MAG: ABC transporter permease [Actinomycetota bacterium]
MSVALLRYLGRRLLHMVPVLFGITLVSFFLIHMIPGDPIKTMLAGKGTEETVAQIRHSLGLDRPLGEQYLRFLTGAVTGDLGQSVLQRRPVSGLIVERLGPSISLLTYGTVVSVIIAFPLAIVSALRRNRFADHAIRMSTMVTFAMPSFWLGLLLLLFFGLQLGWFPTSGYGEGFLGHLWHLTLPAVTIGLYLAPILLRSLRASVIEVMSTEYVEAARARGLSELQVIGKHVTRNSLIPAVTVLAVNIGWLVGGAVVIEHVFSIPGLGQLLVHSIFTRDYPLVQGLTLVFGFLVIVVNLLADLSYGLIDPRIRYD